MDTVVNPLKEFAKNSVRLVKRCTKPDRRGNPLWVRSLGWWPSAILQKYPSKYMPAEFNKITIRTAIGFVVMGFIGFFVKLIFIVSLLLWLTFWKLLHHVYERHLSWHCLCSPSTRSLLAGMPHHSQALTGIASTILSPWLSFCLECSNTTCCAIRRHHWLSHLSAVYWLSHLLAMYLQALIRCSSAGSCNYGRT